MVVKRFKRLRLVLALVHRHSVARLLSRSMVCSMVVTRSRFILVQLK